MKAVYVEVPESLLAERHRLGLDARDEIWEGVLHMVPPPSWEHQRIFLKLAALFLDYFNRNSLGLICAGLGVRDARGAEESYRVPEWFALRPGRESLVRKDSSYINEGPDVVVEVRSAGDETDEKIPFFEKVGVGELLIVDRDTKRPEVWRRSGARLVPVSPGADGWLYCEGLKAFFRVGESKSGATLRVLFELGREEHVI